jgi:hypothetical protein
MTPSRRFSTGGRRDEDNIEVTTSVSAGNTSEESPRRFKQAAEKLFPYRPGPQGSKPHPEPKERPGMKPRNHRSVSFRHISTWPPLWTQSTRPDLKTVKGEVGFLKYVSSWRGPIDKVLSSHRAPKADLPRRLILKEHAFLRPDNRPLAGKHRSLDKRDRRFGNSRR